MAASGSILETGAMHLGALLDAGEDAIVTVVAGDTKLAAHSTVLAARSPVFDTMKFHGNLKKEVAISDVEGVVMRLLLVFIYTLQVPQLCPGVAIKLLAAAQKFRVLGLMAACEQQLTAHLSVDTAAAAAAAAMRYGCSRLEEAAIRFIKAHTQQVMTTPGWAAVVRSQHEIGMELLTRLVAELPAETRSLSAEEWGGRLIEASKEGAVGHVEALLAAGADLIARDASMNTALHCAAAGRHVEVARCLLGAGAEVDARNSVQATPLFRAAYNGHEAVAQLLLASSSDHNARNEDRWTPLHAAAMYGHTSVVRLLLASAVDTEARTKYGSSPLHLAAYDGHGGVAAVLLEAGADKGARNHHAKTPLDTAKEQNKQQLIDMLT